MKISWKKSLRILFSLLSTWDSIQSCDSWEIERESQQPHSAHRLKWATCFRASIECVNTVNAGAKHVFIDAYRAMKPANPSNPINGMKKSLARRSPQWTRSANWCHQCVKFELHLFMSPLCSLKMLSILLILCRVYARCSSMRSLFCERTPELVWADEHDAHPKWNVCKFRNRWCVSSHLALFSSLFLSVRPSTEWFLQ